MVPLKEISCFIDDFCKQFEERSSVKLLPNSRRKRRRCCGLSISEIMTILVLF
ncbi:MAG: hypothetical protein J0H87_07405 [Holosporales bacterium]|nr:hypothetical protein [Holosporales bacterium]